MSTFDKITTEDEAALSQQDFETLATAWGVLNGFRWPEWLPNPEPAEYEHNGRRGQLMSWIENAIGLRACFRFSRPHRDSSEEVFNDFWRGHFEGDAPSLARDRKRTMDLVKAEMARRATQ